MYLQYKDKWDREAIALMLEDLKNGVDIKQRFVWMEDEDFQTPGSASSEGKTVP